MSPLIFYIFILVANGIKSVLYRTIKLTRALMCEEDMSGLAQMSPAGGARLLFDMGFLTAP